MNDTLMSILAMHWTVYLVVYLAIGVVVLCWLLVKHFRVSRDRSESLSSFLQAASGKEESHFRQFVRYRVVPVLTGLTAIIFWPIGVYMMVQEAINDRKQKAEDLAAIFVIKRADLLAPLSIDAIEQREQVVDPLGAVPDLPFGHLHGAWCKFRDGLQAEDAIWYFACVWTGRWGKAVRRTGYVVLRGKAIGPYFLTLSVAIDDQHQNG
jgi:hypothetical protein